MEMILHRIYWWAATHIEFALAQISYWPEEFSVAADASAICKTFFLELLEFGNCFFDIFDLRRESFHDFDVSFILYHWIIVMYMYIIDVRYINIAVSPKIIKGAEPETQLTI